MRRRSDVRYRSAGKSKRKFRLNVRGDNKISQIDIFGALDAAVRERVQVVCMPLAHFTESNAERIVYQRISKRGVLVVCPAGNESGDKPTYPAAYPDLAACEEGHEQRRGPVPQIFERHRPDHHTHGSF